MWMQDGRSDGVIFGQGQKTGAEKTKDDDGRLMDARELVKVSNIWYGTRILTPANEEKMRELTERIGSRSIPFTLLIKGNDIKIIF